MLTIPIAPEQSNQPLYTAITVTAFLVVMIYIYLRKKEEPKDAFLSTLLIATLFAAILCIAFIIDSAAPPSVTATTKDIQHSAGKAGYTYYEELSKNKLKEPDQETIKLTENSTLTLLENTTNKHCTAAFESEIYDTETLEPKEFIYTVSCGAD